MRWLVLSDIHANLPALDAVLAEARGLEVERVLCLGDLVGYHADADAVVTWARASSALCVAGNHDRAAVGGLPIRKFPEKARRPLRHARATLRRENARYLRRLPTTHREDAFIAVHAALHPKPNCEFHLSTLARVERSLLALAKVRPAARICFFGHTHRSGVYELVEGRVVERRAPRIALSPDRFCLVNPGSVGQSRDGDERAQFAVYDSGDQSVSFHRVEYDRTACARRTKLAGLLEPEPRAIEVVSAFFKARILQLADAACGRRLRLGAEGARAR